MGLPLGGIRVVDLTQYQQGPVSTVILADMGAEVIKVEPRETGDPSRKTGPFTPGGLSAYFEAQNRGKKSITVDVRTEKGKECIYRLVEKSDIFAQNFRPGVAARLGFSYEALSRINPRIVYMTASAYGLKGPMAGKPGFDGVGQAMSGIMSTVLVPPNQPPPIIATAVADQTGGFLLALGAMTALFHRERTGEGQEVDVSLLGSVIALMGWTVQSYLFSGRLSQAKRARITSPGITSVHIAKDGKPLLLSPVGPEKKHQVFKVLGVERLLDDPRFQTGEKMAENEEALMAALDEAVRARDRDEWLRLMDEADAIAAPVYNIAEASTDPQVLANEFICEINHPREGPIRLLNVPIKLHKTPGRVGIAPELGQHTDEVLSRIAGYTADELAQMREQNII